MDINFFNYFYKLFKDMDGLTLKQIIERTGRKTADVAKGIGITPQSLNSVFHSDDVKSGTIEKVAQFLGLSMHQMYAQATPAEKENGVPPYNTIKKRDEQIDRLLAIIEKMQENGNRRIDY